MNIDISNEWVDFVKRLNDNENKNENHYLKVMIEYFSNILDCKGAYLIQVEDNKLKWSSYTLYGSHQMFLEMPIATWHQEILLNSEIKRCENLLILPVDIRDELVMVLGFYNLQDLDEKTCEQLAAMAKVGYQRIVNKKMIYQLKTSERIFRLTFDQAGSGMCQSDLSGNVRFANSKFYEMLGYVQEESESINIIDITYEEDIEKDAYFKNQLINKEIPFYSMEKRYVMKNGDITWAYVTVSMMEGKDLEEDFLIGVVQDLNAQKKAEALQKNQEKALEKLVKERTHALVDMNKALIEAHKTKDTGIQELKETKAALEEMAIKDPLTHLYNRRYMMQQLEKEAERFSRYETPFTLIIGDIDHFKLVNDKFGHECGDQVLISISNDLQEALRKIDVLCRWGGEEFLVLLPETNLDAGMFVAERMRESISNKEYMYDEEGLGITMTFGVASNVDYTTIEELIKASDDALYVGKDKGRNIVISG